MNFQEPRVEMVGNTAIQLYSTAMTPLTLTFSPGAPARVIGVRPSSGQGRTITRLVSGTLNLQVETEIRHGQISPATDHTRIVVQAYTIPQFAVGFQM